MSDTGDGPGELDKEVRATLAPVDVSLETTIKHGTRVEKFSYVNYMPVLQDFALSTSSTDPSKLAVYAQAPSCP